MSADGWDTTELGKQGGESFSADYDPVRGVVRLSGQGVTPEEFPVDADQWEQQAAREFATRGYGARWNQWEPGPDGTRVMSAARTGPDTGPAGDADDSWERGAASYSAAAAAAEPDESPAAVYQPPEYGRVRVYPTYTFPVYQAGVGGIGLDQQITVNDWDKKGRDWAEAEARRQVTEALGAPPNTDGTPGGAWWMGQPVKDTFRWQPLKGTPRSAKPNDGLPEAPPWQPWRPDETAAETGPASVPAGPATKRSDPETGRWVVEQPGQPTMYADDEAVADRWLRMTNDPDGTGTGTAGTESWPPGHERDISPAEYNRRIAEAEAAGAPFVLDARDVQPGDRVQDSRDERLGRVREVTDTGGVLVDYDDGDGVNMLSPSLEGGSLRKVPADATYASLEGRRPPVEQAARYADRRAHFEQEHGPGKRGQKGWTAHKRGCRICSDIDAGGDGAGRRLQVVAALPAPPAEGAGGSEGGYPVRFTFAGDEATEVRHWRWEQALDAAQDQVGGWTIPDDRTGVLDVDVFISSIGGYVNGLGTVLGQLAEELGGGQTPIAPVVGEALADFAAALQVMSGEAAQVYEQWRTNPDNEHDLRRAEGEIPGAHLFNVTPAA